ncbi:hypothetical protein JCM11641_005381 [Rhodosporidiobolus odoratus]
MVAEPPLPYYVCPERQATLHHCCLTSKRLCALARRLLWEVIAFTSDYVAFQLEEAPLELRKHTRVLEVDGESGFCDMGAAEMAVKALPNLEDVRLGDLSDEEKLFDWRWCKLEDWTAFSSLRCLALYKITIDAWTSCVFPNLTCLSLVSVKTTFFVSVLGLLAAKHVPSLRGLFLSDIRDHEENKPMFLMLADELLDQLVVLEINISNYNHCPTSYFQHRCHVLLNIHILLSDLLDELFVPASHIRIAPASILLQPSSDDPPDQVLTQDKIDDILTHFLFLSQYIGTGNLRSLWLLPQVNPDDNEVLHPAFVGPRGRLLEACEEYDVDVGYRGGWIGLEDLTVEEGFLEYAELVKEAEEDKAEEGSGEEAT